MITIFTIAGSAVYAAEIPVSDQDQLITSNDWTEISNLQDEMKKEEPDATIDYDKALKVYVDCNLIKLQTADTKVLWKVQIMYGSFLLKWKRHMECLP